MDKSNKNKMKPSANGTTNLTEESERMRLEVVDLELKARYWKAQHDIRFYTLAAEKIQPEYDKYVEIARAKQEQMIKDLQEEINKRGQNELHIAETDPETLDSTVEATDDVKPEEQAPPHFGMEETQPDLLTETKPEEGTDNWDGAQTGT